MQMKKTFSFKVSPYEAELITKLASVNKQSVSEYIRSKVLNVEVNHNTNNSNDDSSKYLVPILQSVLATQKFILETNHITQEKQKEIMDLVIRAVEKLNH